MTFDFLGKSSKDVSKLLKRKCGGGKQTTRWQRKFFKKEEREKTLKFQIHEGDSFDSNLFSSRALKETFFP